MNAIGTYSYFFRVHIKSGSGSNQTLLSGEEWYRYFQDTYGVDIYNETGLLTTIENDIRGSVRLVKDSQGEMATRAEYNAWGEAIEETGTRMGERS